MSASTFRFFIIPIAILLLIASQSLIVIARAWRRQGTLARCGACRYDISGTDNWQCPECGSDLRDAGIATPALRSRQAVSTWQIVSAWLSVAGFAYALTIGVGATGNYAWVQRIERRVEVYASPPISLPEAPALTARSFMDITSESEPFEIGATTSGWTPKQTSLRIAAAYEGRPLAEGMQTMTGRPSSRATLDLARSVLDEATARLAEQGHDAPPETFALLAGLNPGRGNIKFLDPTYMIAGHRLPAWINTELLIGLAGVPFLAFAFVGIAMTQLRRRWLLRQGRRDAERAIAARARGGNSA